MRGALAGLVVVVALLVAPGSALAQPSSADLDAARALFREGVAAGDDGRWADALDRFERAHTLSQRADVLINVAAAQEELGRLVEAAATYRRFQAEADQAMRDQHGAAVASALAALDARIAASSTSPPPHVEEPVLLGPSSVSVAQAEPYTLPPEPPPRHADHTVAIVLGVVGGVLLVGGAVTLGVVLGAPGDAPSYQGNFFPFTIDVD